MIWVSNTLQSILSGSHIPSIKVVDIPPQKIEVTLSHPHFSQISFSPLVCRDRYLSFRFVLGENRSLLRIVVVVELKMIMIMVRYG